MNLFSNEPPPPVSSSHSSEVSHEPPTSAEPPPEPVEPPPSAVAHPLDAVAFSRWIREQPSLRQFNRENKMRELNHSPLFSVHTKIQKAEAEMERLATEQTRLSHEFEKAQAENMEQRKEMEREIRTLKGEEADIVGELEKLQAKSWAALKPHLLRQWVELQRRESARRVVVQERIDKPARKKQYKQTWLYAKLALRRAVATGAKTRLLYMRTKNLNEYTLKCGRAVRLAIDEDHAHENIPDPKWVIANILAIEVWNKPEEHPQWVEEMPDCEGPVMAVDLDPDSIKRSDGLPVGTPF